MASANNKFHCPFIAVLLHDGNTNITTLNQDIFYTAMTNHIRRKKGVGRAKNQEIYLLMADIREGNNSFLVMTIQI